MPLSNFHPVIQSWFRETVGSPTDVQQQAWPRIAAGRHVLLTAPTGSGKTLAAFLWALDGLMTGRLENGALRVLYVSPMRALNNDVRRNLLRPLEALREAFRHAGQATPNINVMTRSGDTPTTERQRMVRRPPEILITTPESLNILLTSKRGRSVLRGIRAVILDEIHAVLGSKRGVHLISAVDRLVPLCGDFQRIALSATVRSLDRVAKWVGGLEASGKGSDTSYRRRQVSIVQSSDTKRFELEVVFPSVRADVRTEPGREGANIWPHLIQELLSALDRNRSSLIFANSKRMVEKLTRFVNEDATQQRVYSHHGALSREIRSVVEQRLKDGCVRGIIATNSLELGIDIGALDEVLMVQSPPSIASALQRIGRAGHGVGEVSKGTFVPLVARDIVNAAVIARGVIEGHIETLTPVCGALDVLAQIVVSMTAAEAWTPEDLLALLRTSDPYHTLSRRHLDLVIDMLTGRYASARVRELRPLISFDRVANILRARRGSDLLVYMSGGTIPDRGYFRLRRAKSMALIGELDEEFVWERSVGDKFTLGVQGWQVTQITNNDVLVEPIKSGSTIAPFWRAESQDRSVELSEAIASFLERAESRLDDESFVNELRQKHLLRGDAIASLLGLLKRQKRATAGMLPHQHRIIIEHVIDPAAQDSFGMVMIHTLWGGRVNRPLAMALQAAWQKKYGVTIEVMQDDDCIVINSVVQLRAEELFHLVPANAVEALLRQRLEHTGYFGARFREAAGRSLLLPRANFRQRNPLWVSRLKGKKLLAAVSRFDDFPLMLEAWRECLQDSFDLPTLRQRLDQVHAGEIELAAVTTTVPSPFAANVAWQQTNVLMYEDDVPEGVAGTQLKPDLLQELVFASHLRPPIARKIALRFERKLQRLEPGWAPRSAEDLLDWIVERVMIPVEEWQQLCVAIEQDHGVLASDLIDALGNKITAISINDNTPTIVVASESIPKLKQALAKGTQFSFTSATLDGTSCVPAKVKQRTSNSIQLTLADLLAEQLRFHGPISKQRLLAPLRIEPSAALEALEALIDSQQIVADSITKDAIETELCDGKNLERLLQIVRAGSRPTLEPCPIQRLLPFLAERQGLYSRKRGAEGLRDVIERLFGLPLPADLWESEVLPARLEGYYGAWLDALLLETDLTWYGGTQRRVSFALDADRELFVLNTNPTNKESDALESLFPHPSGRFAFDQLIAFTGDTSSELSTRLWTHVWKGHITNDGFNAVRVGVASKFKAEKTPAARTERGGRRTRFARWKSAQPSTGSWYRLSTVEVPNNVLEQDEIDRDRVRILLNRWGVLFRELLDREAAPLRWGKVFRTLRIMELSGEVVSGQFFEGIGGLQFASPSALRQLKNSVDNESVIWMSAADPASTCGLGLDGYRDLPRRVPSNHFALVGQDIAVVSESKGKRLTIRLGVQDPRLPACLGFLSNLLARQVANVKCLTVETINAEAASKSPYRSVLEAIFHTTCDRSRLRLMKMYDSG